MSTNLTAQTNFVTDIAEMHQKFGVNTAVDAMDASTLNAMLKFRLDFLREELTESYKAAGYTFISEPHKVEDAFNLTEKDAEEVVDGLIDLIVVAIGTLDAYGIDTKKAWDAVHAANMAKEVGIKASRPNTLGLPDLIKPREWQAPSHTGNIGLLAKAFGNGEAN